jgi:hypothetical protein
MVIEMRSQLGTLKEGDKVLAKDAELKPICGKGQEGSGGCVTYWLNPGLRSRLETPRGGDFRFVEPQSAPWWLLRRRGRGGGRRQCAYRNLVLNTKIPKSPESTKRRPAGRFCVEGDNEARTHPLMATCCFCQLNASFAGQDASLKVLGSCHANDKAELHD